MDQHHLTIEESVLFCPLIYHTFDRSPGAVWEQLDIAQAFDISQVWILNVGDLKLTEIPLDYFLNIAYDSSRWGRNSVGPWIKQWATRDFGPEYADEIVHVLGTFSVSYSKLCLAAADRFDSVTCRGSSLS